MAVGRFSPDEMAISSMMLQKRRSSKSPDGCAGRAPICSARRWPPPLARREVSTHQPPSTNSSTTAVLTAKKCRGNPAPGNQKLHVNPQARASAALTASTSSNTVRANTSNSWRVWPRASRCDSKISTSERHLHGLAFDFAAGGFQHRLGGEIEQARHDQRRKLGRRIVEFEHVVVVSLARETNAVFGAGELFTELPHGLVGLQVGVGLGHRKQAPERATEHLLGTGQRAQRARIQGTGGGALFGPAGPVARRAHGLPGLALLAPKT